MTRENRSNDAPRPIEVTTAVIPEIQSSVQYRCGGTTILCIATLEEGTPKWMSPGQGWATADYQMMPYSVAPRLDRVNKSTPDGRAIEIRRLVGRALRAGLDLSLMPGYTIRVDCDVLHADGGTRTASINATTVALGLLVEQHLTSGIFATDPRRALILAMSAGVYQNSLRVDLDYQEDSGASLDLNLIGTATGEVVEVVGGCENGPVAMEVLQEVIEAARGGIAQVGQQLSDRIAPIRP
ncbi:MAG: ribonuclease PH [Planctomycetes bacterium]|nr:ribonuclease PH [Planctomycetota bacterium]MBT6967855.1 ribonuclease PH [Planctomycetota bacterium]MBT7105008.1 ribonuclease PH [Planctomycetota bacterium]MBT7129245.1 ribonuclease PH [Planctomycetota bacterium]MBT7640221.1 ribonuclease PH [Planctomycetota bacterium]